MIDATNVNFKEALASIQIDLSQQDPMKAKWVLRTTKNKRK
jgi:hypothetical protein